MNTSKLNSIITRRTFARTVLASSIILATVAGQACGQTGAKSAYDYLAKVLVDKKNSDLAVSALHAADDQELTPLFVALSRSGDKRKRLLATTALGQIKGSGAIAALKHQLAEDSAMAVRAAALVHLLNLEAADEDVLIAASKIKDENIQCIAARSLASKSKNAANRNLAKVTLSKLTESSDAMTAAMSRLGLLAMGDSSQMPILKKLVSTPETEAGIIRIMMLQIADEKIAAGVSLTSIVIASQNRPLQIRVLACRALAEASDKPAAALFGAIRNSRSMVFRIPAMGILAEQDGAKPYMDAISKSTLPIAPISRFEQARLTPGPQVAAAVEKALAVGHPVAMNHILQRAKTDIDKLGGKAGFYVSPLLKYIESVEPDTNRLSHKHLMAAQATTLLMDLGTPAAVAGVSKVLDRRYSAITRSAAAGLLRTKNKAVLPLAKKLLKNPYPELATYGALTLGHFADPTAAEHFKRIITRESGHTVAEVTLSSWYLLKINNEGSGAAEKLARLVK